MHREARDLLTIRNYKYKIRITKYKSPMHRAARDLLTIGDYNLQNTKHALQITNRPQGSQGSSEDCNGQSVEETEEDEHWRGEETDSSSDNNNTVSFLQFHHLV